MSLELIQSSSGVATDRWLVRIEKNQAEVGAAIDFEFLGPLSREDLIKLILDNKLSPAAEICRSNGFWFSLHEASLVQGELGLELPSHFFKGSPSEEITDTATDVSTASGAVPTLLTPSQSGNFQTRSQLDGPAGSNLAVPAIRKNEASSPIGSPVGRGTSVDGEPGVLSNPKTLVTLAVALGAIGVILGWRILKVLLR